MQDHFPKDKNATQIDSPKSLHKDLNFWVKREDLNPLGSHKHFAAKNQITYLKSNNIKGVLATSGNAGVATAYEAKKEDVNVYILITPNTKKEKIEKINSLTNNVFLSKKAARFTNYISAKYKLHNLRPSMDRLAVEGFENLGNEIFEQYKELNSKKLNFWKEIYTFSTSGASFAGIYNSLKKLKDQGKIKKIPKMHCVTGFAGRFGTHKSPRNRNTKKILKETQGKEFEIDNKELNIFKAKFPEITKKLSDESLSSLAAALLNSADSQSLVISTGKRWQFINSNFDINSIPTLQTLEDCDKLFS